MKRLGCFVDDPGLREAVEAALVKFGWSIAYAEGGTVPDCDVYLVDCPAHNEALTTLAAAGKSAIVALLAEEENDQAFRYAAAIAAKPIAARELRSALRLAIEIRHRSRTRDDWFQTTLRSIGDAVICADGQGRVTFMNEAAEALTGHQEKSTIGVALDQVFRVEADVQKDAEAREAVTLKTKDGESRVIEQTSSPIVSETGELLGVVLVFRDVTERHQVQQRLETTSRMAALGTLAGGIAHEINNPLSFVTANLHFVGTQLRTLRDIAAEGRLDECFDALAEAEHGAARIAQIVKQLRLFLQSEAAMSMAVDVRRAVTLAVSMTEKEIRQRAELILELEPVPPIIADEGRLVQVLLNLLTNAAQAIDAQASERKVVVSARKRGDHIEIVIRDSGGGIAPEHMPRIFEPFFTTKPVGEAIGLGLSVSQALLASFGATVEVESALGVGTTATVSLVPVAPATLAEESGARVLVVDDEPLVCTAVRRILEKHGFVVETECDGRRAAQRMLDDGERYDVIICDVMMPGFSGADLLEAIIAEVPALAPRLVFMTGSAFMPQTRAILASATSLIFEKPFSPDTVLAVARAVLARQGRVAKT